MFGDMTAAALSRQQCTSQARTAPDDSYKRERAHATTDPARRATRPQHAAAGEQRRGGVTPITHPTSN
eukprot:1207588-Prymnesium_polylepis.4